MKKVIAILLALVMVLSFAALAACDGSNSTDANTNTQPDTQPENNDSTDDGAITREMLEASKPNEYIQEKIAAGMDVLVGQVGIADVEIITVVFASGVQKACDEIGCTFTQTTAGGDNTLFISQMENYVQMGAACLFLIPADTSVVMDTVLAAQEAGTSVIIHGDICTYDTVVERTDLTKQGQIVAHVASKWIDDNIPESEYPVKVSVFGDVSVASQKMMTEAMLEVVEAMPNMTLGYYANSVVNSIPDGYTAAEEALTTEPDLKVFLSFNVGPAIGLNNYLMSLPNIDITQYCIVTGGVDSTFDQMLQDAGNGQGALRAYISEGSTADFYIYETVKNVLLGNWKAPYEYLYDNIAVCEPNFSYDVATDFDYVS